MCRVIEEINTKETIVQINVIISSKTSERVR